MTELKNLIEETIKELVPTVELRDAIFQSMDLQKRFGEGKSVDLLNKYEKIIEGLVK